MLYDSGCGLCAASANFVARHDGARRFRFAALGSDAGRALLTSSGVEPASVDALVLLQDGRLFRGSTAALRVMAGLPWPWKAAAALLAVPAPLREPVYRWVARNRHRLLGGRECPLPDRELRERTLA